MTRSAVTPPRSSRIMMPPRIETQRLVLRPWRRTDAPLLRAVIEGNVDHLRVAVPWVNEAATLPGCEVRIDRFDRAFRSESEWLYAVFSEGETQLLGGAGIHRSTERGALTIGFWLGQAWMKQGYATEAVKALAQHAIDFPHVQRVQIRCPVGNAAAAAVARRAGFTHATTVKNQVFERGVALADTMVFELSRSGPAPTPVKSSPGVWKSIRRFFAGRS